MNKNTAKKNYYYAFFDAEYTCFMENDTFFDRKHSGELLSVGLVICDRSFRLLRTYYSPIRPVYNRRLTGYCRELTGLTQKEIDRAPSYETVFQEMYLLLQEYPVREICTWGNDAHTVLHDMDTNHKGVPKRFRRIAGLLQDITKRLTSRVYGKGMSLSLADMKYVCGMEHHTVHDALEDARDLYRITQCCLQNRYDKERADRLLRYIQSRNAYHQYRRFKKPVVLFADEKRGAGLAAQEATARASRQENRRKLREASLRYIQELKNCCQDVSEEIPPEVLALCDDIRSLIGEESVECPKL